MTVLHKIPLAMTGVGFALLQLASLPVHAVDLQQTGVKIVDPYCASWVWSGSADAPTATCTGPVTQVVGAPTGCVGTVTPTAAVAAIGGPVTLGVTGCNPADAVLGAWQTNLSGASIGGNTLTVPGYNGTSNRAVVATNQACLATDNTNCAPVTAQTTQLGTTPPPPPPTGSISCPGFDSTAVYDQAWASTTTSTRINTSGFSSTTAVVIRYKVPSNVTSTGNGKMAGIESSGGGTPRLVTLSATPCDFAPLAPPPSTVAPAGTSFTMWISVGGAQKSGVALLQPGTTYYLNIANRNGSGDPTCTGGFNCDMLISFGKPSGT